MYPHSQDAPAYFEPEEIDKLVSALLESAASEALDLLELSLFTGIDPVHCWNVQCGHVTVVRKLLHEARASIRLGDRQIPVSAIAADIILGWMQERPTLGRESFLVAPALPRLQGWKKVEDAFERALARIGLKADANGQPRTIMDLPASAILWAASRSESALDRSHLIAASGFDRDDLEALIDDANEVLRPQGRPMRLLFPEEDPVG